MKKAILAALAVMTATGCARPATVASHTASARTEQSEATRNVAPAQSYAVAHRNGVAYSAPVKAERTYTEPTSCEGERPCLERVCEDYARMLGTQLHETPDASGPNGGIMCVLAWSDQCSGYPEIDSEAHGVGGERLCTVRVY